MGEATGEELARVGRRNVGNEGRRRGRGWEEEEGRLMDKQLIRQLRLSISVKKMEYMGLAPAILPLLLQTDLRGAWTCGSRLTVN